MNNKGFALSGIIYGILIIFLLLIFGVLSLMMVRGNTLVRIRENALNNIKNTSDDTVEMNTIIADFNTINLVSNASDYVTIDYTMNVYTPYNYRISHAIAGSNITYSAYNGSTLVTSLIRNINTSAEPLVNEYGYIKGYEKVLLDPGLYKLEVWGGKGTNNGNYASGYLYLKDKKIIYIFVGGKGTHGYNDTITHIAYKNVDYNNDAVIISSIKEPDLINPTFEEATNNSVGRVKITSLIYFTK